MSKHRYLRIQPIGRHSVNFSLETGTEKYKTIDMKRSIAFIILAACLLASCNLGSSLKTLSASGNLLQPNIRMNIQLPRGSITVIADGSAGSTEVTAQVDVYNTGLSGLTLEPASIDDITLELRTEGEVQVVLGEEAENPTSATRSKSMSPPIIYSGPPTPRSRTTSKSGRERSM
jgi:hypothetical protein